MYQFFVEDSQVEEGQIRITGGDVNHIRNVLRMKPGVKVRISAESGRSWFCRLATIEESAVLAVIDEEDALGTELPIRVTLYQGLPKSEKMELIIQKTVELGVHDIVPVAMKNCVMKLDEKKVDARVKRWQAIAESAAKQSKRTVIPEIHRPQSFRQMLPEALRNDYLLVPYENQRGMEATREVLAGIQPGASVGIIIGPEGGFAPDEIQKIKDTSEKEKAEETEEDDAAQAAERTGAGEGAGDCNVCILSLGRRILRTETAGPAALAMLVYELDQ